MGSNPSDTIWQRLISSLDKVLPEGRAGAIAAVGNLRDLPIPGEYRFMLSRISDTFGRPR